MSKIRKAIGALLGGATGAGVAGLLALFGIEIDPALAAALAVILATVGTYLAPPNQEG